MRSRRRDWPQCSTETPGAAGAAMDSMDPCPVSCLVFRSKSPKRKRRRIEACALPFFSCMARSAQINRSVDRTIEWHRSNLVSSS